MTEALLEVDSLEIAFSGRRRWGQPAPVVQAVQGVSFAIGSGETFGLVGESGSGKTTIGRAVLGLLDPTAGQIRFQGEPVSKGPWPTDRRRRLQAIFQDPLASLNPMLTVGALVREILALGGLSASGADRKAEYLFDAVALPATALDRYPIELSGGQRQRVSIARALAADPLLIVCDEPTSALDVSTQAQVLNLLADLQDQLGTSYLFITHDLAVVEKMSHRIGVLYRGELVEVGPATRVATSPGHPYTRLLLASAPHPDPREGEARRLHRAGLDLGIADESTKGCVFAPRCPFAFEPCLTDRPEPHPMVGGGLAACHLHDSGPSLTGSSVIDLPVTIRQAAGPGTDK